MSFLKFVRYIYFAQRASSKISPRKLLMCIYRLMDRMSPLRIPRFSIPHFGATAIVAFVAAAFVLLLSGWQILRTRDALLIGAERDARNLSQALAQQGARTIEGVDLILMDAVEHIEANPDPAHLRAFLERQAGKLAQLGNLVVTDAQGNWIADTARPHLLLSSAERAYFIWHRDHKDRDLHIGERFISRVNGEPGIPLSRRLNNPDGSFAGVICAVLIPKFFEKAYQAFNVGEMGTIDLWSDDGRVLLRHTAMTGGNDQYATTLAAFRTVFDGPSGVIRARSQIDGRDRIFVYEHLEHFPLVVSAAISVDDLLAGWRRSAWIEALVAGLAAATLIVLGWIFERNERRADLFEREARETDERYRIVAENSNDLISLRPSPGGPRAYVSPSSKAILGWETEELLALPIERSVHPDDLDRVEAEFASLTAGQSRLTSVHRLRHKDGHYIWVEAAFHLTEDGSVIVAARDITERHRAQEALAESEARYRTLADATSDVITQLDLNTERQYVSPSCTRVLGYEPEEMLGVRPSASIHPDEAPAVRALAAQLIAGGCDGDRAVTTYQTMHKQGHYVWIEAALNLVRDPASGAPTSIICSLRDVTERQRAARNLERAKAVAEQATRAQCEFVANMSHELRTPLTGILGVHDLLRANPNLSEAQRRLVNLASDAGRSLLNIVNDILDFSKIQAEQLVIESIPFDMRKLVEGCRDLVAHNLRGKPVTLDVSFTPAEPGWYLGDPTRLRQILLNLLSNATKFTERGRIGIDVTYRPETTKLRVDVSDTGIGIPADKVGSLFQRFTQADSSVTRRYGGTGLGLAICKRLTNLMGGQIGVIARPEGGSVFWFELPMRSHTRLPADEAAAGASTGRSGVGRKILLAEDNALNAEIIAAMLINQGYRVTLVSDGKAAVDAARAGDEFDLILMDFQMPVMDGLTATAMIRRDEMSAKRAKTPIIGLTANVMTREVKRSVTAGMDAHVAKPVEWPVLFAAIDRLVPTEGREMSGYIEMRSGSEVFDETKLEDLSKIIGRESLAGMLSRFASDLAVRLAAVEGATPREIAAQVHSLGSLAGQLGFARLSEVCLAIQNEVSEGGEVSHLPEFREAVAHAVAMATSCAYARAA